MVLERLLACHATPGDEGEVRDVLETCWRAVGWRVERLGDYAVTARLAAPVSQTGAHPMVLLCAHMDSPGYAVDRLAPLPSSGSSVVHLGVAELGSPSFEGRASAVLKTARGRFRGELIQLDESGDGPDAAFACAADVVATCGLRHGDRVCFAPNGPVRDGERVRAPFLDNRLGCWLLARVAESARAWRSGCEVVLGATASEEMGGFGARVLAEQVKPDAVVVLDTTYESEAQGVRLGGGPVLTLSDASVLVSPAWRDRVAEVLERVGVPFQTEVYNFSGTDARAFPQAGLTAPVLPFLIPTCGNHEPLETADRRDLAVWPDAVRALVEGLF